MQGGSVCEVKMRVRVAYEVTLKKKTMSLLVKEVLKYYHKGYCFTDAK